MKLVEKKCPNCGANLDFKVGERDVTCAHCRRKYAVQYDGMDFAKLGEDAIKNLKNTNIDLRPVRSAVMFIGISIIVFSILMMSVFIIIGLATRNAAEKRRQEWNEQVQQSDEEFQRETEEMLREYDEAVEKMRGNN